MEKGELTEDSLKEEAMGMMGKMDQNPLFNGMFQEMNNTQNTQNTQNEEDVEKIHKEKIKKN